MKLLNKWVLTKILVSRGRCELPAISRLTPKSLAASKFFLRPAKRKTLRLLTVAEWWRARLRPPWSLRFCDAMFVPLRPICLCPKKVRFGAQAFSKKPIYPLCSLFLPSFLAETITCILKMARCERAPVLHITADTDTDQCVARIVSATNPTVPESHKPRVTTLGKSCRAPQNAP